MPKRYKTSADYAAIAVAPVLIFLMISALVLFLTTVVYRGNYPSRVAWVLSFFTMGAVAVARLAIEQNRKYALGYAAALSLAAIFVMTQYVGSPVFAILMVGVIVYLADRIVFDCTLVDDAIDTSGSGLVDSGRLLMRKRFAVTEPPPESGGGENSPATEKPDPSASTSRSPRKAKRPTHQPGRTVLYLALAALPLFGLGQFLLPDEATAATARKCLAVYLFAALSLLVTTSFLGLRRYLRRRDVEMPAEVTASWLAGGSFLVASIIVIAFILPMPGAAIGIAEPPITLAEAKSFTASRFGFGDEAAEKKGRSPATTPESEQDTGDKEVGGTRTEKGAQAGNAPGGDRKDGPAGSQSGEGQSNENQKTESQKSNDATNDQGNSDDTSQAEKADGADSESGPPDSGDGEGNPEAEGDDADRNSPTDDSAEDSADHSAEDSGPAENSSSSGRNSGSFGDAIGRLGNLLKIILIAALAIIVLIYVAKNFRQLLNWISGLFGGVAKESSDQAFAPESWFADPGEPPRPFSSFSNPIGRESDPAAVIAITFAAADAWLRENVSPRATGETPSEFVGRLRAAATTQKEAPFYSRLATLVDAYNRVAYAQGRPGQGDLDAAKAVWTHLR